MSIPPSKCPEHPEYDDRMVQVVTKVCEGMNFDHREMIVTTVDRTPQHATEDRRDRRKEQRNIRVPRLEKRVVANACIREDRKVRLAPRELFPIRRRAMGHIGRILAT